MKCHDTSGSLQTVDTSYRLGLSIVVGTVLTSALLCLATIGPVPAPARAGHDLGDHGFELGPFRLVERSGRVVTESDLAGRVWIASFIYTRCPLTCPRMTSVVRGLQDRLAKTDIQLVSLSVDPERDTPDVLANYAQTFGADADRWWFLTGPKAEVHALINDRFKLGVVETGAADRQAGAEEFSHSARLALVDRGKVVGYFDSSDPADIHKLVTEARRRQAGGRAWARRLPAVNASLNASSAVLLVLGWILIRSGRIRAHALTMMLTVAVSALFLACYLVYHYQVGSVPFRGVGPIRIVYFTVLLSHTVLATLAVVPLVALTLTHAARRQFKRHARIAKVTFPIWLYVSITGVVIYLMLYQMDFPASPAG
jgi:protein SCO1